MGVAIIQGYQGDVANGALKGGLNVAACSKHFLGYQAERNGQDHGMWFTIL
jgi:beta-glucosidase-like glycosyl hydrolase